MINYLGNNFLTRQISERLAAAQSPAGVRQHPQRRLGAARPLLTHDDAVGPVRRPRHHSHSGQQVLLEIHELI